MMQNQLFDGYRWLLRGLYRYDSFSERVVALLAHYRKPAKPHNRISRTFVLSLALVKALRYVLCELDQATFKFDVGRGWAAGRPGPFSKGRWFRFARRMAF